MANDADVAIVGCGPVGAALATLLGARGIRTVVLERELDVYALPRAAHIDHQGLRLLQQIGCLDEALAGMVRNRSLDLVDAGHRLLFRLPADRPSVSGLPSSMYFHQPSFDRLLRRRAAALPAVEVRTGIELRDFAAVRDGVRVDYATRQGRAGTLTAGWLVGCDGARSTVREIAGLARRDLRFEEQWLVVDLVLDSPPPQLPRDHVVQVCDPARPHLTTPISSDRQRFEFMLLPGERAHDVSEHCFIARLLAGWLPADAYRIERAAVYTFRGVVAERWRSGRVLIAGDAAHLMPPFLGQGMCSGFRDAANLAWKLDLVLGMRAPDALLDTYEPERIAHVTAIVEVAIRIGRLICELDPVRARTRDAALLAGDLAREARLSFALPRLAPGELVAANGGALFIQPEVDGRRLDDIVGPRFLVVGRDDRSLAGGAEWWVRQGAMVATLATLPSPEIGRWLDRHDQDVVVVRPDRYVLGMGRSLDALTRQARPLLEIGTGSGSAAPVRLTPGVP